MDKEFKENIGKIFEEQVNQLIKDATIQKILTHNGNLILGRIASLVTDRGLKSDFDHISWEMMQLLTSKNWLAGTLSLFYCLDLVLQQNPVKAKDEEDKQISYEVEDLIKTLENRMKEKKNNGTDAGEGK